MREVSLAEASCFWLRLGLVSFGGPAGQISLLHRELVERRRWLSERRYLHALNYCMVLPGPEATQLATYLGWLMHGIPGGLIAGGLFLAPSVLVLIGLATLYAFGAQLPLLASVFWALKPAVLAIVLQAAWRVGRRTLHHPALVLVAAGAFGGLALLKLPYPLIVVSAALLGWGLGRWRPQWIQRPSASASAAVPPSALGADATGDGTGNGSAHAPIHGDDTPTPAHARPSRRRLAITLLAWGLATLVPLALLSANFGEQVLLPTMARFFSRVALVSFGGAYAVLPYVAQASVEQFGWLSAAQVVDGLALGETTPGPLIMVLAFVGFMGGWNGGVFGPPGTWIGAAAAALVVVWFTFLPSFGFILCGAPLVEASRNDLRFGAPLTAITAAVVGVIASLAVFFAGPVLWPAGRLDAAALVLALVALMLLLRWRWGVLPLIGAAALVGLLRGVVG
ncbi:MAG: chromate transporter [Cyanobacteriota bacterium]|nr:chromate transporter [Cyanobacteriota bacterium]